MRLVLALLFIVAAAAPVGAQGNSSNSDEILRQRLLLRERFNKSWDVQIENSRGRVESRCKAEARKRYSSVRWLKRRNFVRDCIRRARR